MFPSGVPQRPRQTLLQGEQDHLFPQKRGPHVSLKARDEQFLCWVAQGHAVARVAESTWWASRVSAVLTALTSELTRRGGSSLRPLHTARTLGQGAERRTRWGQGTEGGLKGHREESLCGFHLPLLPPTRLLPFLLSGSGWEWGLLELATLLQRPCPPARTQVPLEVPMSQADCPHLDSPH